MVFFHYYWDQWLFVIVFFSYISLQSFGILLILSPFKMNIKHCATEFQLCKQQRPEDIGSQVVDIYPNWVKVSMFLAAYLYALPTNFLFDFHTSPLISPHISKMHTGKHSSIFAWFCLILNNIFQMAGMLPFCIRLGSFYIKTGEL